MYVWHWCTLLVLKSYQKNRRMSQVKQYFSGKCVFVTGATGFLGKLLLEKLLRSCPSIEQIYILLRPAKGLNVEQRVDELFELPLFANLISASDFWKDKIVPIEGNLRDECLGISETEKQEVLEKTDIFIHAAANTRLINSLESALQDNVHPLKEVLKLCREMKKLQLLCYTSTAFCFPYDQKIIGETLHPLDEPAFKVISDMENLTRRELKQKEREVLQRHPTVYSFTKNLAEHYLAEEAADLPLLIFRPSVVVATSREPFAGWTDNYANVSGLIAGIGKGLLRTYPGELHEAKDIIPADATINCLIVSIWQYCSQGTKGMYICQFTSGKTNPFTFQVLKNVCVPTFKKNPVKVRFRKPAFRFAESEKKFKFQKVMKHNIPGLFGDGLLLISGKKPKLMKTYRILHKSIDGFKYYTLRSWEFKTDAVEKLYESTCEEDREIFNFDLRPIDWYAFMENFTLGVRQYVLKEKDANGNEGQQNFAVDKD